jgi:hypothetical protein
MAQYPPAPPGGGYPPPPPPGGGYPPPPGGGAPGYAAPDPYAADRALQEWASSRGYTLGTNPDFAWYQGWWPFQYAPRLARVGRELRAQFNEAGLFAVEGFEADEIKRAAGEDRQVYALVTSPRLQFRVALRSKSGGGMVNEVSRGLGSLFSGSSAGSVLGDPTLEGRFDVGTPTRDEGNRALPLPLRQLLLHQNWRGIVEIRPGGMLVVNYDRRSFDPQSLEAVTSGAGQIYQLAAQAT